MPEKSPICVAICTRDRGAAIRLPISALLAGTFQDFRVLVVDQSSDHTTRDALAEWDGDPRITYARCGTPGLSHARNVALRLNQSPLLAFTDDDCRPDPDWLESLVAFGQHRDGPFVAFGPFVAAPERQHLGMVPAWAPGRPGPRANAAFRFCLGGFGGNMLLNRAAIECVGEFDENLGRGAPVTAAEEGDYAFRTVLSGGAVWELASPAVTHMGVVPWPQVSDALRNDYGATGTMLAWQLRGGHVSALVQFGHCLGRELLLVASNGFRRSLPFGIRRPLWLLRGAAKGMIGAGPRRSRGTVPAAGEEPAQSGWTWR